MRTNVVYQSQKAVRVRGRKIVMAKQVNGAPTASGKSNRNTCRGRATAADILGRPLSKEPPPVRMTSRLGVAVGMEMLGIQVASS